MFIELTDHLRCPADHPESFLVLLPDEMQDRRVIAGSLGCPVCGRIVRIERGVVTFAVTELSLGRSALDAAAVAALLGLSGPGGFVGLIGSVCRAAKRLIRELEGIGVVLVNPPEGTNPAGAAGVLHAARMPLQAGCLRGIVVGQDFANRAWIAAAARTVLPGYRVVGEGGEPPADLVEVLAASPEAWVGKRSG